MYLNDFQKKTIEMSFRPERDSFRSVRMNNVNLKDCKASFTGSVLGSAHDVVI